MPDRKTKKNGPERLYRLLSSMAKGLEQLYDCLRAQQRALVNCKLDDFNETLLLENRLAGKNLERENRRRELITELLGEQQEMVSLKELATGFENSWPKRFEALAERLRKAGNMVQTMKKQNEFLITRAREMVSERINLLLELARINRGIYEESGKKRKKTNMHKVLDHKA